MDPIAHDALVSARWTGRGTYQGGLPGAIVPAGPPITFGVNDILHMESGQFIESWVSSDSLYLMTQFSVIPAS